MISLMMDNEQTFVAATEIAAICSRRFDRQSETVTFRLKLKGDKDWYTAVCPRDELSRLQYGLGTTVIPAAPGYTFFVYWNDWVDGINSEIISTEDVIGWLIGLNDYPEPVLLSSSHQIGAGDYSICSAIRRPCGMFVTVGDRTYGDQNEWLVEMRARTRPASTTASIPDGLVPFTPKPVTD